VNDFLALVMNNDTVFCECAAEGGVMMIQVVDVRMTFIMRKKISPRGPQDIPEDRSDGFNESKRQFTH
jgi:hypothetical protein